MTTFRKTALLTLVFILSIHVAKAQTAKEPLNQVELLRQFTGTWKCELGKDTILITTNTLFGPGMISDSEITTNGKILDEVKQLYGYDKKKDIFILAELIKSSPAIEVCTCWFTSKNTGEVIVTNPENAPFRFTFEFKNAHTLVQKAIMNNKVVREITLNRIESNQN